MNAPTTSRRRLPALLAIGWLVPMLAVTAALASSRGDDDDRWERGRTVSPPAVVAEECGTCHIVYPRGMLPAESWRRIMSGLGDHFGSDATLDDVTARSVTDWLLEGASTARAVQAPPEDRITRARWFLHEHDRIGADIWRHPGVRSAANCEACHADAARGAFDDDDLVMPPGLDARQRRALRD